MGILNNKENIFDIILTDIGLEKFISEGLNIKYYTFSDQEASYSEESIDNLDISESKIILEANKLPYDSTFPTYLEDNSSCHYKIHDNSLNKNIVNGQILDQTGTAILTKGDATSTFIQYLNNINKEFTFKSSLHTLLGDFDDDSLSLNVNFLEYPVSTDSDKLIIKDIGLEFDSSIPLNENLDEDIPVKIINDPRLELENNFKKLVPFYNIDNERRTFLENGTPAVVQNQTVNKGEVVSKFLKSRQVNLSKKIRFEQTTVDNNLILSFFSFSQDDSIGNLPATFTLLNIIDGGTVDIDNKTKKLFFVGRIMDRSDGVKFFSNIFTILVEV